MIGGIVSGFLNLKGQMPLGVLAIILLISGPSMMLAWLKLRRRNLGPILDANGWAVNAKAKMNVPFGALADRRGHAAARLAAGPGGSVCREEEPVAQDHRGGHPAGPRSISPSTRWVTSMSGPTAASERKEQ